MSTAVRPATVAILDARIELATREMRTNPTPDRLADICANLSALKTQRVRYLSYARQLRAYRHALATGDLDSADRARLEGAIEACEDKLTEIDAEVCR